MKKHIFSALGLLTFLFAAALLLTACGSMKATCTVTFNSNGGSEVPAQRVAKGEKMEKPEDPQKTGYALSGWAYQGEAWSFVGYTVTENMTLDAVWSPVLYSISYELNGGFAENPISYTIEEDDFTLSDATREDHEFLGWTWDGQAEPVIHPVIVRGSFGNKTFIANWKPRLFTVSGNSITGLTNAGKALPAIEIPSAIDGIAITSIGNAAFYNCTGLTSVTIPDGVTSIGNNAFFGCTGLTSVTIGNGVTSIGDSAFVYCYCLVEVRNLSALNITAGSSDYGYAGYHAKRVYKDGESYLHTTDDGFIFYDDGTNIWLVGYSGRETDLSLPVSYNGKQYAIYQYVFRNCKGLTSVTIPDSVTSIGEGAFYNCSGLTNVTISDSVTSIGYEAFRYCTGLKSVTIPDSVRCIRAYAFSGCTGLTSVTIQNSVISIESYAFDGCTGLKDIHYTGTAAQWYKISKGAAYWDNNTGSYTVHYTDGNITK